MSSHQEWQAQVITDNGANKPFAPENGQPLKFKVGDPVIFTNDYGVRFKFRVMGLYQPNPMDSLYARGARYLLDSGAFWFPHTEASLEIDLP